MADVKKAVETDLKKVETDLKKEGTDSKKELSATGSKNVQIVEIKRASISSDDSDEETQPPKDKKSAAEEINPADVPDDRTSLAPTIGGPKPSCCYRFWNAIFRFFAHDSIYGSFVGPHPVSFLCCCLLCKSCCKGTCIRPFILASVATKFMWFIMLLFTMILSCFFIIPYPAKANLEPITDFFPCNDGNRSYRFVNDNITRDCGAHGGYFMVYRNFFAFCFLLLMSSLIMINVKSTNFNRKRAKMHHGFWMYKYIILFILLLICYLGIRVEVGGIFEYIVSWIGLLSALVFSFVELTFLLDLVEFYAVKNRTSTGDWADCLYWTFTAIILIIDLGILAVLCLFYSTDQYDDHKKLKDGEKRNLSGLHIAIIAYALFMTITLIGMAIYNRRKGKFKYTGFLQTAFVIRFLKYELPIQEYMKDCLPEKSLLSEFGYLLGVVWNALGNSYEINARPHFNPYFNSSLEPQAGSYDVYFKVEACFHGLAAFLSLMYYVFWNGPRSKTAPLSILFDKIMYWKAKKPELPVIPPPEEASDEFNEAVENVKVWDDEKHGVRYSWTMFYVLMILGSMSICMAMCNFSDPWAETLYASSKPAFSIKIVISVAVCLTYLIVTTFPCQKIYPEIFVVAEDVPVPPSVDLEAVAEALNDIKKDVVIELTDNPEVKDEKPSEDPTEEAKPVQVPIVQAKA